MPICSVGGAKCFAGSIEDVRTHEAEAHGIRRGKQMSGHGPMPIIIHRASDEAAGFLRDRAAAARKDPRANAPAASKRRKQTYIDEMKRERLMRGY